MLTLRRTSHDLRIEIMPMIDVIFLLLTFFIYAMVLMMPVNLLSLQMQAFSASSSSTPVPAITISIDSNGELFLDREKFGLDRIISKLKQIKADQPNTKIYLAADERGSSDRLPAFLNLLDRLASAGLDFSFLSPRSETQSSTSQ